MAGERFNRTDRAAPPPRPATILQGVASVAIGVLLAAFSIFLAMWGAIIAAGFAVTGVLGVAGGLMVISQARAEKESADSDALQSPGE